MPLEGKDEAFKRLEELMKTKRAAVDKEFIGIGLEILDDSMENECPFKEGHLKASAPLSSYPVITVEETQMILGYGTSYAYRQHEELSYYHPNGKKAKYLEDPIKRRVPTLIQDLVQRVDS